MTDTPAVELVKRDGDQPALELLVKLEAEGKIDAVSLVLTDLELSFDTWESLGRFLGSLDRRVRWYIGDWLNHGEALFGEESAQGVESTTAERYSEAERVTGLDHGTLMNIRSVCARVARSRRRPELGFWIHAEVAALEPDEQIEWLQRAVDDGLTKSELRESIKEAKGGGPPAAGSSSEPADGKTIAERIEDAARLVYHQGQKASDGSVVVQPEPWAQLGAALGEE